MRYFKDVTKVSLQKLFSNDLYDMLIHSEVETLESRLTERPGFGSRQSFFFFFGITSRPALGPTQPPIQWISWAFSLGVKWPGCEADRSPTSKWVELFLHSQIRLMAWCSVKAQGQLYLYLLLYIHLKTLYISKSVQILHCIEACSISPCIYFPDWVCTKRRLSNCIQFGSNAV
jgi:hypothetical protein